VIYFFKFSLFTLSRSN